MRWAALVTIVIAICCCDAVRAQEKMSEDDAAARIEDLGGHARRKSDFQRRQYRKGDRDPYVIVSFFRNSRMKDDDLRVLAAFPDLGWFDAGSTSISDAGLVHLVGLRNLRYLVLYETDITDAGLKTLGGMPQLRSLQIAATKITDRGLAELARLPNLETLWLVKTAVTDAGVANIQHLPKLEQLALGKTQVTDACIPLLKNLPRLRKLYVGEAITDQGLKELGELHNLTDLGIMNTKITDAGLKHLAGLTNLKKLVLTTEHVSLAGLRSLQAALVKTEFAIVLETKISDADIAKLRAALPRAVIDVPQQQRGQRADPTFDVSVAHPAYTDKHPRVLFDEAHRNRDTSSGLYKVFVDLITNDGYQVTPNHEPFTAALLAKCDLLVIANAPAPRRSSSLSAFSPAESDAVQQWVQNGGSLLLITNAPFGSGSELLAERFGVNMGLRLIRDTANQIDDHLVFSREKDLLGDHAILRGRSESERINRVFTFNGQSLKGPPGSFDLLKLSETAKEEIRDPRGPMSARRNMMSATGGKASSSAGPKEMSAAGRAQGIALQDGRGRVVVMGDAADLAAQLFGVGPPRKIGMNVPGCDNRQFALNIVHWLSGLIE
jgi:hypothetical protein